MTGLCCWWVSLWATWRSHSVTLQRWTLTPPLWKQHEIKTKSFWAWSSIRKEQSPSRGLNIKITHTQIWNGDKPRRQQRTMKATYESHKCRRWRSRPRPRGCRQSWVTRRRLIAGLSPELISERCLFVCWIPPDYMSALEWPAGSDNETKHHTHTTLFTSLTRKEKLSNLSVSEWRWAIHTMFNNMRNIIHRCRPAVSSLKTGFTFCRFLF